jgi:hypothetical protein
MMSERSTVFFGCQTVETGAARLEKMMDNRPGHINYLVLAIFWTPFFISSVNIQQLPLKNRKFFDSILAIVRIL